MADLTGTSPSNTYKDLLQVPNSNSGIDGTLRTMQDGEGTNSTVQFSTTAFNILATATWTSAADLSFSQANPNLFGADTNGVFSISSGVTAILGSNVKMYGDTHASKADDFEVFGSATLQLLYDDSASIWNFQANAITTSGAIDGANLDGILGANTPAAVTATSGTFSGTVQKNGTHPAFLARNSVTDTDATGDGTAVTVDFDTEVIDQGGNFATDTFTAPVTGLYALSTSVLVSDLGAGHTTYQLQIITSNRTYEILLCDGAAVSSSGALLRVAGTIMADMDASDTAFVRLTVTGSTKTVDIGSGSVFGGHLAA